jgi:hypothetical protein
MVRADPDRATLGVTAGDDDRSSRAASTSSAQHRFVVRRTVGAVMIAWAAPVPDHRLVGVVAHRRRGFVLRVPERETIHRQRLAVDEL